MRNDRNILIVNHRGFYPPLLKALRERGLVPVFDQWHPTASLLRQTLACVVWFYDCLRHPVRIWALRQRLMRHGVPIVSWNRDAPHYLNRKPWRLDLLDRFRLLDIYATHTLVDQKRSFADLQLYLPNAADVTRYNPGPRLDELFAVLRKQETYRWDVSFFGGMNGERYKEDRAREEFFTALAAKLEAKGLRYCFREADGMPVEKQIEFIRASRINLNFGARCEYGAPIASGLPERCYGIPAAGGFLLCDWRLHARDDFTPGENWAEYEGIEDCVQKIGFWLTHFAAARDLAERCHHHVMAHHTYFHRAAKLHAAILAWHEGHRGLIR